MARSASFENDVHIEGTLSSGALSIPSGTIIDADVNNAAAIQVGKLQHQHVIEYHQADALIAVADTVADESAIVHICQGVGEVLAVEVVCAVTPDADTDFFTVDVKRVRAGAAASVLTGVITYNNTNAPANWTILTGTIDGAQDDLVDGDMIEVFIDATNNGGANASAPCVTVTIKEAA